MRLVLISLALLLAQPAAAKAEKFGSWELICIGPKEKTHCAIQTALKKSDEDWASVEVDPWYGFTLFFAVPNTKDTPQTLSVRYGRKPFTLRLRYQLCNEVSCTATISISKSQAAELLRAPLTVYAQEGKEALTVPTEDLRKALSTLKK